MAVYTLIKVVDRSRREGEYGSDAEALAAFGAQVGETLTLVGDGAASYIIGAKATREAEGTIDTPVFSTVADDAILSVTG